MLYIKIQEFFKVKFSQKW